VGVFFVLGGGLEDFVGVVRICVYDDCEYA
jgi:hypothetical protein